MRWFWSTGSDVSDSKKTPDTDAASTSTPAPTEIGNSNGKDNGNGLIPDTLAAYTSTSSLVPALILTSAILISIRTYKRHFRRIPTEAHLHPTRHLSSQHTTADLSAAAKSERRTSSSSLFGRVTSVGDADNFRFYHTPGGWLAGWHWLRNVPATAKALRNETLHIRIAGIDAPELAHFGRPAQPHSAEALEWLKKQIDGRDVRIWLHRRDQYGRVVGSAFARRAGGLAVGLPRSWMRDIGQDMIKAGWATVYEAKFGAEFGGKEAQYRVAEQAAKRDRRGMWGGTCSDSSWTLRVLEVAGLRKPKEDAAFESPRQYKTRIKELEARAGSPDKMTK